MQTLTYSQYCKNRMARKNLGWINGQYIHEGKLYSPKEIEQMFPIHYPIISALDRRTHDANPDKKQNYLKDVKSY